jgi:hypothetical protein
MNAMLPALSVLFAVFATAVPWGLPVDATFILPLVVVMMVFCWRALPGTVLPPYLAMLLGLLTDVVSGGPLGFWALMTLIAATAGADRRTGHESALAGLGRRCRRDGLPRLVARLALFPPLDRLVADRRRRSGFHRALSRRAARSAVDQARQAPA